MNLIELALLKDGALDRTQDLALRMIKVPKDEYVIEVVAALAFTLASIIKGGMNDKGWTKVGAVKLVSDTSAFVNKLVNDDFNLTNE